VGVFFRKRLPSAALPLNCRCAVRFVNWRFFVYFKARAMLVCVHACVSAGVRECRCALVCVWDTHARTHTQTHTHTHTHTGEILQGGKGNMRHRAHQHVAQAKSARQPRERQQGFHCAGLCFVQGGAPAARMKGTWLLVHKYTLGHLRFRSLEVSHVRCLSAYELEGGLLRVPISATTLSFEARFSCMRALLKLI